MLDCLLHQGARRRLAALELAASALDTPPREQLPLGLQQGIPRRLEDFVHMGGGKFPGSGLDGSAERGQVVLGEGARGARLNRLQRARDVGSRRYARVHAVDEGLRLAQPSDELGRFRNGDLHLEVPRGGIDQGERFDTILHRALRLG